MNDYKNLVNSVIEAIGGKDNISSCWHCATRLRVELKDWGLLNKEMLGNISGVAGYKELQGQLQIIIGPGVAKVYDIFCDTAGIMKEKQIDEKIDEDLGKIKESLGSKIVNAISKSFIPIIEIIVATSFIKMFATLLGPGMLEIISAESDLYVLLNFVGDAGFYFLPIYMGMSAAKTFKASPMLGMLVGAILLHPTLTAIVANGQPFTVFGIPMTLASYASSTIPAFITVWIMSYIEKFFKKVVPDALKMMLVPLLTVLVILPIELCLVGPLGTWIGNALATITISLASTSQISYVLVGTIVGGIFIFAILFGMHVPLFMIAVGMIAETGFDGLILPGMMTSVFALLGMEIGALLRLKKSEEKSLCASYLLTHAIGGITEPAIFGIGMRYKKPIICSCIGAAIGALFIGIAGAKVYTVVASSSIFAVTAFLGGTTMNAVLGIAGLGIATIAGAILTYMFGFTKEQMSGE